MTELCVSLFGRFSAICHGQPLTTFRTQKVQALFILLATDPVPHSRDKLMTLLWENEPHAVAQRNVRQALYHLRKLVRSADCDPIISDRHTITLDPARVSVDVCRFRAAIAQTADHAHGDITQCATCAATLSAAVAEYAGSFLGDFYLADANAFELWAETQRTDLHQQMSAALTTLTASQLAHWQFAPAEQTARHLLALDDLNEAGYRYLMEALARGGRRDAALQVYDRCRQRLWEELRVAPDVLTRQLETQITRGQLNGVVPTVPLASDVAARNPFKGLRPFDEADVADFFGRNQLITQISERIAAFPFLALVGASGSGKSSIVRAGVLPRLRARSADQHIHITKPSEPLPESADWLIIDQFEELWTLVTDPHTRASYIDQLLTAHDAGTRILLTLRADFYHRPLRHPVFASLLNDHTQLVLPPHDGELREAICAPLAAVGVTIEPALVTTMLDALRGQPGALPLLQYTLTELFEQREGNALTLAAYEALGGVDGTLGQQAELLFETLDATGRRWTRHLFLRLVTLGEGQADSRRRVTLTELNGLDERVAEVLDRFGRKRLLTFDSSGQTSTVEIAHEALLTAWPRLAGWLEASRGDVRQQRVLAELAQAWQAAERDPSFLLRGRRLAQLEAWSAETTLVLADVERDFLTDSVAAETTQRSQQLALMQRSQRFLRLLVVLLLVLTIGATAATITFFQQRNTIAAERDFSAEQAADALQALSLAWTAHAQRALDEQDTTTALALAVAANEIANPPPAAQQVLRAAAIAPNATQLWTAQSLFGTAQSPTEIVYMPDGQHALAGFANGTLLRWHVASEHVVLRSATHDAAITALAVHPDGASWFSADADGAIYHWRNDERVLWAAQSGAVNALAISPDGRWLVVGGVAGRDLESPGKLWLWEIDTKQAVALHGVHQNAIAAVTFTPDSGRLIVASGRTTYAGTPTHQLVMWDVASHQPLHHLPAADHDNRTLAITPDGRWLLTGSADQTVYRYDLQSAAEPQRWQAHTDRVESLAISSDGHRLLSATDSGALLLWDVDTGTTIARWSLHSAAVDALALDPTGKTALVAAADGTLSAWDVRGSGEVGRFGKHPASVLDVAWLPDGRHFIASIGRITGDAPLAADNAPRLWDSATGRIVRTFDGHTDAVFQMVVQGNRLITTSYDQTVRIWDVATGEEIGRIWANSILTAVAANADTIVTGGLDGSLIAWDATQTRHLQTFAASATWPVWDVAISADGTRLLAASDDGIRLWDVETGERLAHWQDHSETVTAVIFAPDGRTAFSSGNESAILRWDVATGAVLQRYDGHGGIRTRLAVSSDGTRLYSSGWDGKLIVRDVTTGEVLQTLSGHATTFIMDLAIQDGRLLTAGADGSAIVWEEVVSADWLQWVSQHRYVRDLRCDEWETFQIGDQSNGCADPID